MFGQEAILPIECEIISLKLSIKLLLATFIGEEHLLHLNCLDETRNDATIANGAHKRHIKV